ncbi:MAG: hypothetical protein ACPG8W_09945 [Candidatus Promineifilaceae bacterium]
MKSTDTPVLLIEPPPKTNWDGIDGTDLYRCFQDSRTLNSF